MSDGIVGLAEEPIYTNNWLIGGGDRKSSAATLNMACICVNCAHGCSPVSISTTKQPTLHISALRVCDVCFTTSGAIQKTDPCRDGRFTRLPSRSINKVQALTITEISNYLLSSTFFEIPKSDILMPPLLSTKIFAPLISRWIISRS